jgi:hypothetical protein
MINSGAHMFKQEKRAALASSRAIAVREDKLVQAPCRLIPEPSSAGAAPAALPIPAGAAHSYRSSGK